MGRWAQHMLKKYGVKGLTDNAAFIRKLEAEEAQLNRIGGLTDKIKGIPLPKDRYTGNMEDTGTFNSAYKPHFLHFLIIDQVKGEEHYYKKRFLQADTDWLAYFASAQVTNYYSFRAWFTGMYFEKVNKFDAEALYIEEGAEHTLFRVIIEKGPKLRFEQVLFKNLLPPPAPKKGRK